MEYDFHDVALPHADAYGAGSSHLREVTTNLQAAAAGKNHRQSLDIVFFAKPNLEAPAQPGLNEPGRAAER
jgi:hypothetical protein